MIFSPEIIISLLTALGLAGIFGAFFQSHFERQKQVQEQEHELKRRRYGAILILMLTKLDPKVGLPRAREIRPDLKNIEDIEKEIETELLNGFLFASDNVLKSIAGFIRNPNHSTYVKTASAMRRDLWGRKTAVDEQVVTIFHNNDKLN